MHCKILTFGISIAFVIGFSACERHDWEQTQKLHQPHGDHGHGEGEAPHDDDHAKGDAHHEADHHGDEKKDAETHEGAEAAQPAVEKPAPRELGKE